MVNRSGGVDEVAMAGVIVLMTQGAGVARMALTERRVVAIGARRIMQTRQRKSNGGVIKSHAVEP